VYESLHIQEHTAWDAFAYRPTSSFGEGATAILTELAMTRHGQAITQHSYPTEVALVGKMNAHAGLEKLRAAYFKGRDRRPPDGGDGRFEGRDNVGAVPGPRGRRRPRRGADAAEVTDPVGRPSTVWPPSCRPTSAGGS
jgi:hypothetical protein